MYCDEITSPSGSYHATGYRYCTPVLTWNGPYVCMYVCKETYLVEKKMFFQQEQFLAQQE